jgi:hypothetical protein
MTTYFETKEQYLAFRSAWKKAAQEKKLTGAHHVLLNILRGHPVERGFTPITKTTKLQNGFRINHGLYFAAGELSSLASGASSDSKWQKERAERFIAPFEGTLTLEQLATIEVPSIPSLQSDFGKGRKIAQKIMESDKKNISFADIDELMKEAA